ncbi:proline iminopeptidase protein [Rutstroemia sp. NJR-2017a WRK4]|nr:proline iminopeptidase protein [Rutstroemia sp. NJR-2017a WRK4]
MERNRAYYQKFPEDVEAVHSLAIHINSKGGLSLPSGGTLTVRMFLTLGINFGFHGGLDFVHQLIHHQFSFVTRATLQAVDDAISKDNNIIYAILHEPIYCQGQASNWAAEKVGKGIHEFRWLTGEPPCPNAVTEEPLFFSGEMIYPFMFQTSPELEKISPVAHHLAEYSDWPDVYDEWQLARNEVPLYAASYVDDMYVDFGLAQETARMVKGCKQFITNTMYHDAVRSQTDQMMVELFKLRDDSID